MIRRFLTAILASLCVIASVSAKSRTVVVELFTSEGCSSCPRADDLLGDLLQRDWGGGEVYGLSFHVDYWDRLGWKDRFSDKAHTQRRYRYAESLPDSRVYTPQMVVDGRVGFVGSDRAKAMEAAVSEADAVSVSLNVDDVSDGVVRLMYEVDSPRDGLDLNVALAQRRVSTDVKHGENGGRVLSHTNVVRAYKRFSLGKAGKGKTKLRMPKDLAAGDLDVVVYVQDRTSQVILGAAQVKLKGEL